MKTVKRFRLPLPLTGLFVLSWVLSPQCFGAGLPSGTWKMQVSDVTNHVWDAAAIDELQSPSLEFSAQDTTINFDAPFAQNGAGKLVGAGNTQIDVDSSIFTGPVQGTYVSRGTVTGAKGIARLTIASSAKGIAQIDGGTHMVSSSAAIKLAIDSVSQTVTGTYKSAAAASGYGAIHDAGSLNVSWSDVQASMGDGNWTLHLNVTNDAVKTVGGTATVALSTGSNLSFAVKGKYNSKTDSTLLVLTADAESKGSSLKVNWAGNGAATLQGKLTGQTIKTSAVAVSE